MGLKGYYRIVVSKDAEMKEVVQDTGFFENLITDAGLHAFASFSKSTTRKSFRLEFFKEIYLGEGTTIPTTEDTSLENLGATGENLTYSRGINTSDEVILDFGDYIGLEMKKQFGKGDFVGKLSEVGLGVTTTSVLFSRALVVSENGTPSPFTVTSKDYLTVFYTLLQYIPSQKTFNITADIDGMATPMEVRVQPWSKTAVFGVNKYYYFDFHPGKATGSGFDCFAWNDTTDDFQKTLTNPVGTGVKISFIPYDAINKPFESWGKLVLNENQWNGTIKTITILGLPGSWQLRFTPEIVKTNGKTMEIEFGVRLGRYE